jgi:mannan endo-1,4-beta-mannosidase
LIEKVTKFQLDVAGNGYDGNAAQNLGNFYANVDAIAAYDNRIQHILNFTSKSYHGKRFGELSNVIGTWNIQNESMGHLQNQFPGWHCGRAEHAKKFTSIPISTGGGIDYASSLKEEFFACPFIDYIGIHSYNLDKHSAKKALSDGIKLARKYSKKVYLEEFGSTLDKARVMKPIIELCNTFGIPWMVWQTVKPNNDTDFEFWEDDEAMWSLLRIAAQTARERKSAVTPSL